MDKPCNICGDRTAAPESTRCEDCALVLLAASKALPRTALRLMPEAAALAIIIFVLPAVGHPCFWLTIPVLCVGIPRAWRTFQKRVKRFSRECLHTYTAFHLGFAEGYVQGIQEANANYREELHREILSCSIPVTPEIEEALQGRRRPQGLPQPDHEAIQQASKP